MIDHLGHCRRELRAFEALLGHDLSAPIEHCGPWDLYRLADHLGRQNLWSAAGITEGHGDFTSPRAPRSPDELTPWFRGTSDTLLAALAREPDAPAWTIYPPGTVGFWRRRRAHETLIHRWDAEHALGLASAVDPELAADGIAEVFDTMLPRQLAMGRTRVPGGAIAFRAGTLDILWGTGEPIASVQVAAPEQLLLLLWKRASLDDADVTVGGDAATVREFFAADLVP